MKASFDHDTAISRPVINVNSLHRSASLPGQTLWLDQGFESDLVSVVIPTFNRRDLIGDAIDSLAAQTWPRLEIIVVDDGSTDGTADYLASRSDFGAGRILSVIRQENGGVSAARNTGTRAARGEFIIYLDSDDRLYPEAVTRYVEALRVHDVLYCIAPVACSDETGRRISGLSHYYPRYQTADYLFECFWLVHGACYRREVLSRAGPWNETLTHSEDIELYWRIKVIAGRAPCLDEVQGIYRQHSDDQLHLRITDKAFFRNRLTALGSFADWLECKEGLDRTMRIRLARQCRLLATRLIILGDREGKDLALDRIERLLAGIWHPLRFAKLQRHVNVPWLYQGLARMRYHFRRKAKPTPARTGVAEAKPSLLFLSPVPPNPEGKGTARRAAAVIAALSLRHQVTLLIIGSPRYDLSLLPPAGYLEGRWHYLPHQERRRSQWQRGFERRWPRLYRRLFAMPVTWCDITRERRRAAARIVDGSHFDVVHTFRLSMVPYALTLRTRLPVDTRFDLDMDDIESVCGHRLAHLMRRNGEDRLAVLQARTAEDYARFERRHLPRFDRVYVCSNTDRVRLREMHGDLRVLPNIARPPSKLRPSAAPGGPMRLLFLGVLDYYPNFDGLQWFCRDILPRARQTCHCELWVGGRRAALQLLALMEATEGVNFFGEFPTTDDGFARGDVLVVPLRAGGGTRIKILEAFARECPVVSTALGIEGIAAEAERDYLAAESPEDFARQIARLADEPALGARLAANGRRLWQELYSPEALAQILAPAAGKGTD